MSMNEPGISYTTGIQWPQPQKGRESSPNQRALVGGTDHVAQSREDQYSSVPLEKLSDLSLEGKAVQLGKLLQAKKRAQDLQKVTVYLPKSLCSTLLVLKNGNLIESFSQVIKDALFQYLTN